MNREEIYVKLDDVFRKIFDDSSIAVNDFTTADDIEDWDSLEHINLVVAIEKEFGIKFNMSEVNSFDNVGEMVDAIIRRIQS